MTKTDTAEAVRYRVTGMSVSALENSNVNAIREMSSLIAATCASRTRPCEDDKYELR